ncbi:Uncharacterised protein [Mycobacteroides abscessus subsp. bolletii]|nr:Uncharacterised protein [Mycobacteroides abscessus subsp. bolletii]
MFDALPPKVLFMTYWGVNYRLRDDVGAISDAGTPNG